MAADLFASATVTTVTGVLCRRRPIHAPGYAMRCRASGRADLLPLRLRKQAKLGKNIVYLCTFAVIVGNIRPCDDAILADDIGGGVGKSVSAIAVRLLHVHLEKFEYLAV